MPYDGNGQWHPPSGTHATPLTPISSAAYNAFQDDNAAAHNSLRPVVSGGTGASNAADARSNLRIATTIETKSANYTAVAADRAKMLVFTSAATLSLTAAATLGSDWFCYVRNESSGDIIIDPDSSETVDGLASVLIPPGYTVTIWCDGTSFYTDLPKTLQRVYPLAGVSAHDYEVPDGALFEEFFFAYALPSSDGNLQVRVSTDGSSFPSASDSYKRAYVIGSSTAENADSTMMFSMPVRTLSGLIGCLMYHPGGSGRYAILHSSVGSNNVSVGNVTGIHSGRTKDTGTWKYIRFFVTAGQFSSGHLIRRTTFA